jgi:hypothetical protein
MAFRLKSKGRPRGKPFQKGNKLAAISGGGKPFVKWRQKLSVIAAEELSAAADPALCQLVGISPGATNGECVVRAMILEAVAEKSVAAANFLFQATEAAKVRVEINAEVNLEVYERALRFLDSIPDLPALPEGEPS